MQAEIELDRSQQPTDRAFRMVLAGDAAVGKSSFLLRLCKNEFTENTKATLGRLPKMLPAHRDHHNHSSLIVTLTGTTTTTLV